MSFHDFLVERRKKQPLSWITCSFLCHVLFISAVYTFSSYWVRYNGCKKDKHCRRKKSGSYFSNASKCLKSFYPFFKICIPLLFYVHVCSWRPLWVRMGNSTWRNKQPNMLITLIDQWSPSFLKSTDCTAVPLAAQSRLSDKLMMPCPAAASTGGWKRDRSITDMDDLSRKFSLHRSCGENSK